MQKSIEAPAQDMEGIAPVQRVPGGGGVWFQNGACRLLDILASAIGLTLLFPLFLLVVVMIKRDSPGPIFFWGKRVGRNGRPFHILKFRTMYEQPQEDNGPPITGREDGRITPIGHWLRDTKLNELPQLWNVLKGEMSLVGPRPEDPTFVARWPEAARQKILSVRPGITSPASVIYRNEEQLLGSKNVVDEYISAILPSKLRLDMLYVTHRTLWTDWDVLFWTAIILLPKLRQTNVPEKLLLWGPLARFSRRYFSWFAIDLIVALGAVSSASLLWRADRPLDEGVLMMGAVAAGMAISFSLVNSSLGLGRIFWSNADAGRILDLFFSTCLTTILLLLVNQFAAIVHLPIGLIVFSALLAFIGFVAVRYRSRIITGVATRWMQVRGMTNIGERALIVGAGGVGEFAHWLLRTGQLARAFCVVGMVDDNLVKQGAEIAGCSVLGPLDAIPELVVRHDIGLLIFAIENIDEAARRRVQELCRTTSARLVLLPNILQEMRHQMAAAEADAGQSSWESAAAVQRQHLLTRLKELNPLIAQEKWPVVKIKLNEIQRSLEKFE